jgi:hypothetical protein
VPPVQKEGFVTILSVLGAPKFKTPPGGFAALGPLWFKI